MKRVLRTTMMALLMAILVVGMLAPAALAADLSMNVEIPIKINVSGSEPVSGAYAVFCLSAVTEGAPLPNGADGEYILAVPIAHSGTTEAAIKFTVPEMGLYQYTLQMIGGTYFHAGEDGVLYHVDVYNLADGSDEWEDTVEIYTTMPGEKYEELNYNWPLTIVKTAKTWIDQNSTRPSSIEVALLQGGETVVLKVVNSNGEIVDYTFAPITLSSKNNWQGAWRGVDARGGECSVKEVKVPVGYTVSYKYDDGVYKGINTGSLLQTGQLNWPIPVLVIVGMLMLGVGCLMLRKKEDKNA